ncbi:MAG: hypothetical protein JSR78_09415 [Proteobacteria bacterium]|nr:hypothetical protein [Pseudomonadota bacterium]
MRARRILQAGAFTPDDVTRLQTAFDLAWQRIEATVDTAHHPRAREALAIVVVSAGNVSGLDAEELAGFAQRTFSTLRSVDEA